MHSRRLGLLIKDRWLLYGLGQEVYALEGFLSQQRRVDGWSQQDIRVYLQED